MRQVIWNADESDKHSASRRDAKKSERASAGGSDKVLVSHSHPRALPPSSPVASSRLGESFILTTIAKALQRRTIPTRLSGIAYAAKLGELRVPTDVSQCSTFAPTGNANISATR